MTINYKRISAGGNTIKNRKEYHILDGRSFNFRFFNPSPGNPRISNLEFDEYFIYANWIDGSKTKTKLDRVEFDDENDKDIGITLWYDGFSLFLSNKEEPEDFNEDDLDGNEFDEGEEDYG